MIISANPATSQILCSTVFFIMIDYILINEASRIDHVCLAWPDPDRQTLFRTGRYRLEMISARTERGLSRPLLSLTAVTRSTTSAW